MTTGEEGGGDELPLPLWPDQLQALVELFNSPEQPMAVADFSYPTISQMTLDRLLRAGCVAHELGRYRITERGKEISRLSELARRSRIRRIK